MTLNSTEQINSSRLHEVFSAPSQVAIQENTIATSPSARDILDISSNSQSSNSVESNNWLSSLGKFIGSIGVNALVGMGGAALGGIIGSFFFPPFGTIAGTAIGSALGSALGDYASQRFVEGKANEKISWGGIFGSSIIGGLTGGANSLVMVAKNLIQLGSMEVGEQILSSVIGRVASFFAPSSGLTLKGLGSRVVVNSSMGAVSGLSQLVLDKDAKATDVLLSVLGSVILGEAIHIGVKRLSSINLSKGLMNGVGKIDEAIASLNPNECMNVFVNNTGEITVKSGNHFSEDGHYLLASISRNADYSLTVIASKLADDVKSQYPAANKLTIGKSQMLGKMSIFDLGQPLKLGSSKFIGNYSPSNITNLISIELEPSVVKALKLLDPQNNKIFAAGKNSFIREKDKDFYGGKLFIGQFDIKDPALPIYLQTIQKALNVPEVFPEPSIQKLLRVAVIAHEYGHSEDPNLQNFLAFLKDKDSRKKVQGMKFNPELSSEENNLKIQRAYRQIPAEKFADNWAIDFLKKHGYEIFSDDPELQKLFVK